MSPAWLRRADRRSSWAVAMALGLLVASEVHPVSWATVLERARRLDVQYHDVYSELHGRPFASCDSYPEQRKEALASVETTDEPLWSALRTYNRRLIAHYAEDCRLPWRPYANAARFQAYFSQSYGLYFLVTTFGWSEAYLGLFAIAVAWAGLVAFALACVWCWRSTLAPLAGFTIASSLLSVSFAASMGLRPPSLPWILVVPGDALYPLVTVGVVTAMVTLVPAGWRALKHPAYWILPVLCAVHGWFYAVVDPPVARMYVWVALGVAAFAMVAGRDWARASCVVLAAAAFGAVWHWYGIAAREMYAVVSGYDHLASEAFAPYMMYMGLLERPSPLGLFYMDEVFGWGYAQDAAVGVVAPHLAAHYSLGDVGSTLFRDAFWSHPMMVFDAIARRLLVQLFYRPLWYDWVVRVDWVYTASVFAVAAITATAIVFRRRWLPFTLISLAIAVNQFALDTLMTLVHVHPRWNRLGVLLMFGTAPLYLFLLLWMWRQESLRRTVRMVLSGRPARVVVVATIGLAILGGTHARTLLANERENLTIWMHALAPPDGSIDIEGLLARLDARRSRATGTRMGLSRCGRRHCCSSTNIDTRFQR